MNYKNTEVRVEELEFEVTYQMVDFYKEKVIKELEALVYQQVRGIPLNVTPLKRLIESIADNEALSIEEERLYDEEKNLFV